MLEDENILCSETYSTTDDKVYIVSRRDKENIVAVPVRNKSNTSLKKKIKLIIQELFLPKGYPHSVSSDYTAYQIWDTAQAFCSTILGILATHEILRGVGVGDASASASAATVTWVLRDATAHIGRITFAWAEGSSMDMSSKQWRLFADVLNDVALTLELSLPFIGYTTWLLCLTTAMKAIVGVAGSATRAALTQHQAQRNNLADVAAKDSSQETAVNLIASLTAIAFFPQTFHTLFLWWFLLTFSHIYCNYRAVKSICLNTINGTRFMQLIKLYLMHEIVAPPSEINLREPIFFRHNYTDMQFTGFQIKLGQSLNGVIKLRDISPQELAQLSELFADTHYLIVMDTSRLTIHILLNEEAAAGDILCSYFHATILGIVYHSVNQLPLRILNSRAEYSDRPFSQLCRAVKEKHPPRTNFHPRLLTFLRDVCTHEWIQFHKLLEDTGWNTDRHLMNVDDWRVNWKNAFVSMPSSTITLDNHPQQRKHRKQSSEWMIKANNYVNIHDSDRNITGGETEDEIALPGKSKHKRQGNQHQKEMYSSGVKKKSGHSFSKLKLLHSHRKQTVEEIEDEIIFPEQLHNSEENLPPVPDTSTDSKKED